MAYQPIENHAIIGDMHTAALVSVDGAIDWLCLPRFDSPAVFAKLLDDQKGGTFQIAPADMAGAVSKQAYWPDTNVLVTRFLLEGAAAELIDFMPTGEDSAVDPTHRQVIRRVTAMSGTITMRLVCRPAFDFAREAHTLTLSDKGAAFAARTTNLALVSSVPLQAEDGAAIAEFQLHAGEVATFILRDCTDPANLEDRFAPIDTEAAFHATVRYWRGWLAQSTYRGRWREMVDRSALALKLMTYAPTGAIVAAPTTSLPEEIGGERNWDYRYTWLRDSAFTVFSLARLGFTEECVRFAEFLQGLCKNSNPDGSLQIMYGIDGRHDLGEAALDHLDGYRGSRPVRVGNGAYNQLQLDIYGELMDALFLINRDIKPIGYDMWTTVERIVAFVIENWQQPDEGIWETRGGRQHFIYSKLMCWVAIDRAIKIAVNRSLPVDLGHWIASRDTIYREIMDRGWNEDGGFFVQHYHSSTLDASNLMMIVTGFLSPNEPRTERFLDAVMKPPSEGGLLANSLVYRYNQHETSDGLEGGEGAFNLCTFWLVNALARAGWHNPKRRDEALLVFERMHGIANHVGLYAEETGASGQALGNFPQAFTHLGLITAAINLDRAIEGAGERR